MLSQSRPVFSVVIPMFNEAVIVGEMHRRLAGVMATKRTPDLIPLCHPIALTGVTVEVTLDEGGAAVRAEVKTLDRTGVEMEALTAAATAALTIYDMVKSVDRGMVIESLQLEHKAGGRTGTWDRGSAG